VKQIFFRITAAFFAAGLLMLMGCAATAPQYQTANSNIQTLSEGTAKAGVGNFAYGRKGAQLNRLTLRGSSYNSPIEGSWVAYVREALKTELIAANRFSENSDAIITGTLLENTLDGSGTNVGVARISMEFVVERSSGVVYKRQLTIDKQWESSFIGAIAIPAAQQNYIAAISELLGKLFADNDFKRAIE
jgi:hypothetical protein